VARVCVFCGGRPVTTEHVLPRWLLGYMEINSPITLTHARRPVRIDRGLAVELNAVCGRCNNGWMSDLEAEFRESCGRLILGEPGSLDLHAQQAAATWAVKTALLLELAWRYLDTATYAPPSHFSYLHEHHSAPSDDARVWVGAVDAQATQLAWSRAVSFAGPDGVADAYLATVAVGYLVLQTFGRDIALRRPQTGRAQREMPSPPEPLQPFFDQIWPQQQAVVSWPPRLAFPLGNLDAIFESG
jgi:hypothetical protein